MITDFMHQTASIYALNSQVDASGGVFQQWTKMTESKCLVQPYNGGIDREQAKDGSAATDIIYLPGGWSLSAKNQVKVGSLTYNILRCRNINSMNRHTELECILETS